jgi:hypothetical protein
MRHTTEGDQLHNTRPRAYLQQGNISLYSALTLGYENLPINFKIEIIINVPRRGETMLEPPSENPSWGPRKHILRNGEVHSRHPVEIPERGI